MRKTIKNTGAAPEHVWNRCTVEDMLALQGLTEKQIDAIKAGYEGCEWFNGVQAFLAVGHYGQEILIKTAMVIDGTYDAWNPELRTISKRIAFRLRNVANHRHPTKIAEQTRLRLVYQTEGFYVQQGTGVTFTWDRTGFIVTKVDHEVYAAGI